MLISVHMPKTAGTSFRASLQEHFGEGLSLDYSDVPINTPTLKRNFRAVRAAWGGRKNSRPNIKCVHGHFLPLKYLLFGDRRKLKFVTWLRDPVERVVSHYHGWMRNRKPAGTALLHQRVLEEGWDLERFCLSEEIRNLYSKFLWGFNPRRFDFIGITEFYDEDFAHFSRQYFGRELDVRKLNVGHRKESTYALDDSFRARVAKFHESDVRLYRWANERRRERLKT